MIIDHLHPIALILLTEAHVAVPVPLCHAGVVHHEEVHLKSVCTSSLNLVVMSSYELNHLHTASITWLGRGHVALRICPVPGVMAPRVIPGVTVKTVNSVPCHTVPPCLICIRYHHCE